MTILDRHSTASRRPALLGEVAVFVGLLFVYDRLRTLAPIHRAEALRHGDSVLSAEGPLAWERGFNHWLAHHGTLAELSVGYYQFLHIGAALAVLTWCYVRRPDVYRPARTALVVTNAIGLVGFGLYPVAPPRLLPSAGFLDLVARAGYGSSHGPIPMDAYAAMPSLHLAWALCVAMTGLAMSRTKLIRLAFVLHPILTGIIVIGTGNHYLADVAAGLALGSLASVAAGLRWAHRAEHVASPVVAAERPFTVVSFHAHPDDETLFTGGTLARAAAEGHRVVVVVATLGEAGLTADQASGEALAERRLMELQAAAGALGCARMTWLGYADSGRFGEVRSADAFAAADVSEAAARLAAILLQERADVLTTYDAAGGYGHPDHVRVHEVGARAAAIAGTPVVLEATVDRRAVLWVARVLRMVPGLPAEFRPDHIRAAFTSRDRLTHRVDVRAYVARKRAAMRAHASQASGGDGPRSLAIYLRVPQPLFRRVFGTEWFVEASRPGGAPLVDDIFASLRALPDDGRAADEDSPYRPHQVAFSLAAQGLDTMSRR